MMKGHLRASTYRSQVEDSKQVTKATTDTSSSKWTTLGIDVCDWTPITWHLKGTTTTVVSLYLDCGQPLTEGINSRKLTGLAAFLRTVGGDFNVEPQVFEDSGWPQMMGAASLITLPEGHHACFLGQSQSNIDFAMANEMGMDLVRGHRGDIRRPLEAAHRLEVDAERRGAGRGVQEVGDAEELPTPSEAAEAAKPEQQEVKAKAAKKGGGAGKRGRQRRGQRNQKGRRRRRPRRGGRGEAE